MQRKPIQLPARSVIVPWLALIVMAVFLSSPGQANPLPPGVLMVHVQPVDPDFCDQSPITSCDEIVQLTEEIGELEFDLFVHTFGLGPPGTPLYDLQAIVSWPSAWSIVSAEICNEGEGSVGYVAGDNHAIVDISWPDCPLLTSDTVFLACRILMNVTGDGIFHAYFQDGSLGCPPDLEPLWLVDGAARAGIECAFCWQPCDFSTLCGGELSPTYLALEVVQGATTQGEINAHLWDAGMNPCDPAFVGDEDWMDIDVVWIGEYDRLLLVTADAANLDPGYYEGWVRSEDECVFCTRVGLEVLPSSQGIPEGPPAGSPEEPGLSNTWGQIKALYR